MRTRVSKGLIATGVTMLALLGAAPALAAERYAEPGGDGPAATCPQADPCGIQVAIEDPAVNDGDVVTLLPGTYAIATNPIQPTDAVTIRGLAGQPRPLIVAGVNSRAIRLYLPGTVLRHVAIEYGGGVGIALSATAGTVENVFVHSDSVSPACELLDMTLRDSVCWNSGDGYAIESWPSGTSATTTLRNVTAFAQSAPALRVNAGGSSMTINATNLSPSAPRSISEHRPSAAGRRPR